MAQATVKSDPTEAFEQLVAARGRGERYPIFAGLRETAPVFFSPSLELWVISRYEDVLHVLRDEAVFVNLSEGRGAPLHGRILLNMTGSEHRAKVRPLAKRIRDPGRLQTELGPLIESIVAPAVEQLPPAPEQVDLRAELTRRFPLEVITRLLDLGAAKQFEPWYDAINRAGLESVAQPEARAEGERAIEELQRFLTPIIEERRRDPGNDVLSDLCQLRHDGAPLPDREIVGYTSFLLVAGTETTDRALCNLLVELGLDRDLWEAVRDDRSLIVALCAEILRHQPPVQGLQRQVAEDTEISGVRLAAGDRVLALIASANRDGSVFDDPERFEPKRFADDADRQFVGAGHTLPFGAGRHFCTGSMVAKLEMSLALEHLLDRFDWLEAVEGRPEGMGLVMHSPERFVARLHATH